MANRAVYINGEVRSGNLSKDLSKDWGPRFDYFSIPVKLKKGSAENLFHCRRVLLKAKLHLNQTGLLFAEKDLTDPLYLIVNTSLDTYGSVAVVNASEKSYESVFIKTRSEGSTSEYYLIKQLHLLSINKARFFINPPIQIEEASKLDGLSDLGFYLCIMLSFVRSIIVTMVIFKVMWAWNIFYWLLLVVNFMDIYTLLLELMLFKGINVTCPIGIINCRCSSNRLL